MLFQAGELSTLIPLQYAARLAVLVGDQQQLPATVLSIQAKRRGFGRSLFERLQQCGHPCRVLRTQYRMHPAIRAFPSAHFYHSLLRDGPRVQQAARVPPGSQGGPPVFLGHGAPELRLTPYAFFNLHDSRQGRSDASHSLHNESEAAFATYLLEALLSAAPPPAAPPPPPDPASPPPPCRNCGLPPKILVGDRRASGGGCPWGDLCGRVALLTPYNAQCKEIERRISSRFGSGAHRGISVSNVDTFQESR